MVKLSLGLKIQKTYFRLTYFFILKPKTTFSLAAGPCKFFSLQKTTPHQVFGDLTSYRKDLFWVSTFLLLANCSRAKNQTWPPSAWFGQTNFFPMEGRKEKYIS